MTFKEPWQLAQHVKLSHPDKTRNALRNRMGVRTPARKRLPRAEPSIEHIETVVPTTNFAVRVTSPEDYSDLDQNSYDLGFAAGMQAGMMKILSKRAA